MSERKSEKKYSRSRSRSKGKEEKQYSRSRSRSQPKRGKKRKKSISTSRSRSRGGCRPMKQAAFCIECAGDECQWCAKDTERYELCEEINADYHRWCEVLVPRHFDDRKAEHWIKEVLKMTGVQGHLVRDILRRDDPNEIIAYVENMYGLLFALHKCVEWRTTHAEDCVDEPCRDEEHDQAIKTVFNGCALAVERFLMGRFRFDEDREAWIQTSPPHELAQRAQIYKQQAAAAVKAATAPGLGLGSKRRRKKRKR